MQISEDELQEALQAAVVCTILAKAGPQRSRILANLYKDERTHGLDLFPFMEKVYLERILRPDEVRCAPNPQAYSHCQ
jgi:COP9 signalosome complex subunit 4